MKENSIEADIKICEEKIKFLNKKYADEHGEDYYPAITVSTTFNARTLLAFENLLTRYKQLEEENKAIEEEKEQYKNDYFNLYEQNKQYIHYSKIEELAEKIHNELDKNGITRAYQTIIDSYFDEVLGG